MSRASSHGVHCRLQPSAVVTDEDCAACKFNAPDKTCLRNMNWVWRGETYAATSAEYYGIKNQIASEPLPPEHEGGPPRSFDQLPLEDRQKLLKDRLKKYCQKVGTAKTHSKHAFSIGLHQKS